LPSPLACHLPHTSCHTVWTLCPRAAALTCLPNIPRSLMPLRLSASCSLALHGALCLWHSPHGRVAAEKNSQSLSLEGTLRRQRAECLLALLALGAHLHAHLSASWSERQGEGGLGQWEEHSRHGGGLGGHRRPCHVSAFSSQPSCLWEKTFSQVSQPQPSLWGGKEEGAVTGEGGRGVVGMMSRQAGGGRGHGLATTRRGPGCGGQWDSVTVALTPLPDWRAPRTFGGATIADLLPTPSPILTGGCTCRFPITTCRATIPYLPSRIYPMTLCSFHPTRYTPCEQAFVAGGHIPHPAPHYLPTPHYTVSHPTPPHPAYTHP